MVLRRLANLTEHKRSVGSESGAVLALVALTLVLLLLVGALAVDLSALERRGQQLQNAADAAALAGVAVWLETQDLDKTTATVESIALQNRVDPDDADVLIEVEIKEGNEIGVVISDTKPDVYLRLDRLGGTGTLTRRAKARLERCDLACTPGVKSLPPPFEPVVASDDGDGYLPISVENKFYGLNHHEDRIDCVDRETLDTCWQSQSAFAASGPINDQIVYSATTWPATGPLIWWTAQAASELRIYCWDTQVDEPCPTSYPIASLERADYLENNYRNRGGGTVMVDGEIYVFADDHRTYCFDPKALQICDGYTGGLLTGLGLAGVEPLDPAFGVTGAAIDRVVNPKSGQIFHTLHIESNVESDAKYGVETTGLWVDCWDTIEALPCEGFVPVKAHPTGARQEGRLFFHRDATGEIDGLCSTGIGEIGCFDLFGNRDAVIESELAALQAELPTADAYSNAQGVHMYHAKSNRLVLTLPRTTSTNLCWDFSSSQLCGSIHGFASGVETQDYGFTVQDDCIYSLGHNSTFWVFDIDMNAGCELSTLEFQIEQCKCEGNGRWGAIRVDSGLSDEQKFELFEVAVFDPEGNLVLPDDGTEAVSLVDTPDAVIDLSPVSNDHEFLTIKVRAKANPSVWLNDPRPQISVDFHALPHLTD